MVEEGRGIRVGIEDGLASRRLLTAEARLAPTDFKVAMVPRWTSSACMLPRSMLIFTLSQLPRLSGH
jgi:hypothetical protein